MKAPQEIKNLLRHREKHPKAYALFYTLWNKDSIDVIEFDSHTTWESLKIKREQQIKPARQSVVRNVIVN